MVSEMPTKVRFCRDCQHSTPTDRYWTCKLRDGTLDLVIGEPEPYRYCVVRRINPNDGCGPEGKLWEPR